MSNEDGAPLRIEMKRNQRGFVLGEFVDRYGVPCSIQESSLATEAAIWLGSDDAVPLQCVYGKGWQPVPNMPDEYIVHTRMHLTVEQVKALLPLLHYFVDTGQLPPPGVAPEQRIIGSCDEAEDVAEQLQRSRETHNGDG